MYKVLSFVSAWSILIPLIIGVMYCNRLKTDSKFIFAIVLFGTIPQMIHFFLYKSKSEIVSYNVYTVIEFLTYFFLFFHKLLNKKIIIISLFLLLLYISIASYFACKLGFSNRFINELALLNALSFLLIIGFTLYEIFEFNKSDLDTKSPFFWYTTGILLYAVCTSMVYSLWQRISSSKENSILQNLWNLQNIFNIITYLLFTIGFLIDKKKKKEL